ncbi:MAG TPA: YihY/virulence factor BrkB family protein, partial [Opitutaceae bacterium]|nr:YihY/virulence factor BrkB family protein [Opitutaceae bacterium]
LRLAPWLGMAAMAAFWRKRGRPREPAPLSPEQFDAAEPGRGRAARFPWRIPPLGWKDIAWRTYHEYGRSRLPALAGGVTFYVLLAAFPAIAAFVSLYGMFSNVTTVEQQFLHLSTIFPREAVDLIGAQMIRIAFQRHGVLSIAFALSALVSVWSANAGMKALFDAINVAYNETEKRPYLPRTVMTYLATLSAILFIVAVAAIAIIAPVILHLSGLHSLAEAWKVLRWLVMWLIASLAFTLAYRFGPSRRPPRWRWVTFGAVFAAAAWMAGSLGFSWYLDTFTHLGVTYGSLGAMIGLMLWVWFSVMIVLLGAELNSEIEHQTACDTTRGGPRPIGERGAVMADSVGQAFTVSPRQARDITASFFVRQGVTVLDFFRGLVGMRR